jgi:hypothetical protein
MAVCQSAADAPAAMRTLQLMTAAGSDVVPDIITFNTALGACVRGAAWHHATTVLERMQQTNIQCALSPTDPPIRSLLPRIGTESLSTLV